MRLLVDSYLANDAIFLFGFYSYFLIKSTTKIDDFVVRGQRLQNYKGFALLIFICFFSLFVFFFSVRNLLSVYLQLLVNKLNRSTSLGCNLKEKNHSSLITRGKTFFQVYSFTCNINRSHENSFVRMRMKTLL